MEHDRPKVLRLTPLVWAQIERVQRASALYPNADEGSGPLEREQLLLAEEIMREVVAQSHRLGAFPMKGAAVRPVIEVELRRKRSGTE